MQNEQIQMLLHSLNLRRQRLRMTFAVLAKRSGVSMPTVVRALTQNSSDPGIGTIDAIARAMGLELKLEQRIGVHQILESQARTKARQIVGMVQGTSGLEAQAINDEAIAELTHQTMHDLLAGSRRRLWGD